MKSRTAQHTCASWSGLDLASLNHIKPRQHRLPMARPCTRLNVSQEVLGDDYFFFFLLVVFFAFFAFFAFLATLPSAIPRLVQCKSTLDVHKYRVHHNCKIDTARFEEGKRRSHRCVLQVSEPLSRPVGAIRGHGLLPSWRTSVTRLTRSHADNGKHLEVMQFCSELWRAP
jgi:hypothetical protein